MSQKTTTGTEVVTRQEARASVLSVIKEREGEIQLALPKHLPLDKFMRVTATSLQKNELLLSCDRSSIVLSVLSAAARGLLPDGRLGALVPFWNGRTQKYDCQFIAMYQGLLHLIRQSDEVEYCSAEIVRAGDVFRIVKGAHPDLIHEPCIDGDPGDIRGAYAIAFLRGSDRPMFDWMTAAEIDKVRDRSPSARKKTGPWFSEMDYPEMARKTPLRRLAKYLPQNEELARLLEEEDREQDITRMSIAVPTEIPPAAEQLPPQGKLDKLMQGMPMPKCEAHDSPQPCRYCADVAEKKKELALHEAQLEQRLRQQAEEAAPKPKAPAGLDGYQAPPLSDEEVARLEAAQQRGEQEQEKGKPEVRRCRQGPYPVPEDLAEVCSEKEYSTAGISPETFFSIIRLTVADPETKPVIANYIDSLNLSTPQLRYLREDEAQELLKMLKGEPAPATAPGLAEPVSDPTGNYMKLPGARMQDGKVVIDCPNNPGSSYFPNYCETKCSHKNGCPSWE